MADEPRRRRRGFGLRIGYHTRTMKLHWTRIGLLAGAVISGMFVKRRA